MSFKGLTKGIVRTPQSIKQKFHIGQVTQDPVYIDAERRFKELETETKKLHDESKKYSTAINGMLKHQIEFSKAVEEIYKPISGKMSDPNSTKPEGNPDGIKACEQYREVVGELMESLKPELEMIETRIVAPAEELLKIIKAIRKMATKRDHKQLDLDRHQSTLSKLQDKKERSVKDEERMYAAENSVEMAKQEFDYYNDMMKEELPKLFQYEADFIRPLFQSFYYLQLNIFYTIFVRMEEMKIPYFDLSSDILEQFNMKRGNIQDVADAIPLTHFKVGHAKTKLEMTRRKFGKEGEAAGYGSASPGAYGAAPGAYGAAPGAYGAAPGAYGAAPGAAPAYGGAPAGYDAAAGGAAPPAYSGYSQYPSEKAQYVPGQTVQQPMYQPSYGQPAAAAAVQPVATGASQPPYSNTASPAPAGQEFCTALYDYQSTTPGDLSFTTGSRIQVLNKDPNGWWTGVFNGATGVFPGNYVQLG